MQSFKTLLFLAFFLSFSLLCDAQSIINYDNEWKAITKAENESLPKTALELTEKLYEKILKDVSNPLRHGQRIKALIFLNKFKARLEEDGLVKAIYRFQEEEQKATFPVKQVLQSMLAEMYDRYLREHLYKFQNRTTTADFKQEDIRSWDIRKITQKSYDLYRLSIANEALKNIAIEDISTIISKGRGVKNLRPSLYDFLAHRALDFFISDKYYLTKPAYAFNLNDSIYFANATNFVKLKIASKDSLSASFQALICLQQLTQFHHQDSLSAALIDVELKRLNYVYQKSILMNKGRHYINSLLNLYKRYQSEEKSTDIAFKIANYYKNKGNSYQSGKSEQNRWMLKKAYEWCNKALESFPKSYGAINCQNLKYQIESKSLRIDTEKVNSINSPILSLISYKNLNKVFVKMIPVSKEQYRQFNRKYGKEKVQFINRMKVAYSFNQKLINDGDFQKHSTEVAIPPLKNGQYILAVSANKSFSYDENGIAYSTFYVSDLVLTHRSNQGVKEFYITDRNNGRPLQDVKAVFFVNKYNSLLRKYEKIKIHTAISDKNGCVKSTIYQDKNAYYRNRFVVRLTRNNEVLELDNNYSNYKPSKPYERERTQFFLDRKIYRPGQTVYFKGLVLSQMSDGKNPEIVKNALRFVEFYDANYQLVSKVEVRSNEYGTFNGSFVCPSSGLLGQMRLKDNKNNSTIYFGVEEYKRPKFEVQAMPITSSYTIGDTVTVQGQAVAFAGNKIDGAKVQYRVYRQARFPYWNWRWGWNIPYNRSRQVIIFGETKTDKKGQYTIQFAALADESIPKDRNPEFSYGVEVTVTDINGETHSSNSSVRVGYIGLDIDLQLSSKMDRKSDTTIKIKSHNLNYQYEASKGSIKIEQLKTPGTVYKKRLWALPDYFVMTGKEFQQKFPHYAWKSANNKNTWDVVQTVLSDSFSTEKSKKIHLDGIGKWTQGYYKVTLNTADKNNKSIEIVKFFTLYDRDEKSTPINNALFLPKQHHYKIQPDTTISIDFGCFDQNSWVLFEVEHNKAIVYQKWIQPKGISKQTIAVEEKHRGNLHYHISSIQHGRFYQKSGTIYVPWKNKDLNIEYTTFRNKLYPGQEEAWTLKISGPKGDKVAAEVLAGMYDASLDAFAPNNWKFNPYVTSSSSMALNASNYFSVVRSNLLKYSWNKRGTSKSRAYPSLMWHGFSFHEYDYYRGRVEKMAEVMSTAEAPMSEAMVEEEEVMDVAMNDQKESATQKLSVPLSGNNNGAYLQDSLKMTAADGNNNFDAIKVRTNLNETVFFFPELHCDENGNVLLKFTMNEALTKWKFLLLAHTQDLKTATSTREVLTQKDLMVMPNAPRFFRQKDTLYFSAKVSNMTDSFLSGFAKLSLFDALTMQAIDTAFINTNAIVPFETKGKQSAALNWKIVVPADWSNAVIHRVVAQAGNFSDGEESAVPVLSNRMMVTETQPLPVRGKTTKKFTFKSMQEASKSNSLLHHKLSLEFTQNPAWYAIQSLPYLMEYPYECTEQIFSRYYANSLATSVANAHPKIKKVFEQWKNIDKDALKSNLSKNEELKYALLAETPWVLAAQNEATQKQNIGLLFDLNKMSYEQNKARDKMAERQMANGGFGWMPGGMHSWYITQYIVEGMGHLQKLGVKNIEADDKMKKVLQKAISFIDEELALHYNKLLKRAKESKDEKAYLDNDHLDYLAIHYLYARTFFLGQEIDSKKCQEAMTYYEGQAQKYWLNKSMYMQGMIALALHRKGADKETPMKIVKSAKENALNSKELGMYWKYPSGYFWYQLPVETHALMIELFEEVAKDAKAVEDLKVWLLKAKQTTHWKTTKATASATYALLMNGDNWLTEDKEIQITLGKEKLDLSKVKKEAGTGYFKKSWTPDEIKPQMAKIKVKNPNNVVAWGAMYWQYFEDLDKIKHFKETPLKINKKLFKQINTASGPILKAVDKEQLSPGDLIKVRIELKVDRNMEYVHMKDMRAAGLEPTNILSRYKYQGGLGYYESTGDVATNFFFSYLSKGTYVFEYPLRVNHKGDFSNGVTTIQCMYAPEFTAHSEGLRLNIQ